MKKILIVSPHFPPSNLAAVHRSRLFAQHLPAFGWEPVIITVHEKFYEERLDPNIEKLLPKNLRIEKTGALPTRPVKLIGDIGIRGFVPLLSRIINISRTEKIDFLYIPIPANFASLLGPIVQKLTGIPYGIDYIDPWVHPWPGSDKLFTRAWWSYKLSAWLEPVAVKKARLITGVAHGYYEAVLQRNPHLRNSAVTCAMPYGGEAHDHEIARQLNLEPYLFEKQEGMIDLVYAGALLPKAVEPLNRILKSISKCISEVAGIRFHFIGTGKSPNDPHSYNIRAVAEKYGLWQTTIFEYPQRIPYLDVLSHLNVADGAFILGSTEAHYTPSKVYQSVLSGKPVFAVLHQESSACEVIEKTGVGITLAFNGAQDLDKIETEFIGFLKTYLAVVATYNPANIDIKKFSQYSAENVTRTLVKAVELALEITPNLTVK